MVWGIIQTRVAGAEPRLNLIALVLHENAIKEERVKVHIQPQRWIVVPPTNASALPSRGQKAASPGSNPTVKKRHEATARPRSRRTAQPESVRRGA
jgi:hypothetical protein